MAPVVEDGGSQPAGVVQDNGNVQEPSELELALNRSDYYMDDYLNISSLFPDNTVFLTPNSPETAAAAKSAVPDAAPSGKVQEPNVPKEVPYYTQTESNKSSDSGAAVPRETSYYGQVGIAGSTAPHSDARPNGESRTAEPSFEHSEQANLQSIPDFSCLTLEDPEFHDPLVIYKTLEPYIPDQPDAASNDDLNLSRTKFDELHSPTTPATVEALNKPNLLPESAPAPAAIAPPTVQWSVVIPADEATTASSAAASMSAHLPSQPIPANTQVQPAAQQTILIYNPHAATQDAALTSVNISPPQPPPATVDLSLQNMLVAAAIRKQAKSNPAPAAKCNVIPVVSYSRNQVTVIPTSEEPTTPKSCAELFSTFTDDDDDASQDQPMETQVVEKQPAAGGSSPPGYLEIPHNYVLSSSSGNQQVYKVHELYRDPLYHPLVEEVGAAAAKDPQPQPPASPSQSPTKGKKRQRRTDIDYASGFECLPCGKTFGKKGSLEQHKRFHHSEPRPFLCKQCGKSFITEDKLKQHQRNHLASNKRFKCTDCEKRYVHAKDRDRHFLMHHGEGAFRCEECPKSFARRDHLLAHIVSHRKRQERAERKEAEKLAKQLAAKERAAAKKARTTGSSPARQSTGSASSSSDSSTEYSSEESSDACFMN